MNYWRQKGGNVEETETYPRYSFPYTFIQSWCWCKKEHVMCHLLKSIHTLPGFCCLKEEVSSMNSLRLVQKSVNGDPGPDLPSWAESMTSQLQLKRSEMIINVEPEDWPFLKQHFIHSFILLIIIAYLLNTFTAIYIWVASFQPLKLCDMTSYTKCLNPCFWGWKGFI